MITSRTGHGELDLLPIERASTLSARWYCDPRVHDLEQRGLWPASWHLVGHANRLAEAGDYLVLDVAGRPLITVCGNDGVIRTFYNVCRHRGGPLAYEDGHAQQLQCRYHGWIYSLDGRLERTREFEGVENFDPDCHGLVPVRTVVLNGLIFAWLGNQPEDGIQAVMNTITRRMDGDQFTGKRFHARVNYELACNWKLFVDNYLEGYHLPFVHPELSETLSYRDYVTETWDHCSLQTCSFSEGTGAYGENSGAVYYWFVYPNLMFNMLPGRLQTNLVVPLAADRCLVIFDYYYDEASTGERVSADMKLSDEVQREDIAVCEHVQRGLESGAWSGGRFSVRRETGVYHFQSLLRADYRRLLNEQGASEHAHQDDSV